MKILNAFRGGVTMNFQLSSSVPGTVRWNKKSPKKGLNKGFIERSTCRRDSLAPRLLPKMVGVLDLPWVRLGADCAAITTSSFARATSTATGFLGLLVRNCLFGVPATASRTCKSWRFA